MLSVGLPKEADSQKDEPLEPQPCDFTLSLIAIKKAEDLSLRMVLIVSKIGRSVSQQCFADRTKIKQKSIAQTGCCSGLERY
jgi:excinuclease UvrABC helicase subunit UvrB